MTKGDIILITFPFTDLSGSKLRPAVVLAADENDVTVCFITTQVDWRKATDLLLEPDTENGLRKASLVRVSKLATIDRRLSKGRLGRLSSLNGKDLDSKLKLLLQLAS